ncbi:MAG: hypothetical protein R8K54_03635 [Mariprofundaceae bacterium]
MHYLSKVQTWYMYSLWMVTFAINLITSANVSTAGPITFNSALPVSEGVGILRSQVKIIKKSGDSTAQNRNLTVTAIPLVLAYGITSKLALFGILPYIDKRMDITMGSARIRRSSQGLGDAIFFGRYTVYQADHPGDTFRIAPFAGLKTPTGSHLKRDAFGLLPQPLQSGSGSWDPFVGIAITRQTLDLEFDMASSYRFNSEASGFEFGNEARLDASYQYRIFPRTLESGSLGFTYVVLESNLIWNGKNRSLNTIDPNSGGLTWNIAPGLQYVTARFVLETTVQIPAIQNLNGTALETDWTWTTGFRWNF